MEERGWRVWEEGPGWGIEWGRGQEAWKGVKGVGWGRLEVGVSPGCLAHSVLTLWLGKLGHRHHPLLRVI